MEPGYLERRPSLQIEKPTSSPAERETIGAKYGINFGIEYSHTSGVADLAGYEWYFSGYRRTAATPEIANWLGTQVGETVIYFPPGFRHVEHALLRRAGFCERLAR